MNRARSRLAAFVVIGLAACPSPPSPSTSPAVSAPPPAPARELTELTPPIPSEAMIETMMAHVVLSHPRVVPFLHFEISSNVPLKLFAGPDLARGAPALQAAGKPVVIVAKEQARVVLESRERLDRSTSRIRFQIPPEGVIGHIDVALRDGVWTAVGDSVAER